ncbi:MAG: AAA family ATPase, partial [Pseudomonadota bacterium]
RSSRPKAGSAEKVLRIGRIELQPFGRFDDVAFDFPRPAKGPDLHIIVGANEAGKTTLRQALMGLLFGIPGNSPYLYRGGRPRLAGDIEIDGASITLERVATGTGGKPAKAIDALKEALKAHGVTRDVFALTQAFSHADMRTQAEALALSKGDLSELLLRGRGGLEAVPKVLNALQEEARSLYSTDKRNTKARYREREAAWIAADKVFEAAKLEAPRYAELSHAADLARHNEAAARRQKAQAEAARDRMVRLIDAEPIHAAITEHSAALAGIAVVELAPDARDRVQALADALAAAQAPIPSLRARIASLTSERKALDRDPGPLDRADDIADLVAREAELRTLSRQREKARSEHDAARREAVSRAREIGLEAALDDIAKTLPTRLTRQRARDHAVKHEALTLRLKTAADNLDELARRPEPETAKSPSPALMAAR